MDKETKKTSWASLCLLIGISVLTLAVSWSLGSCAMDGSGDGVAEKPGLLGLEISMAEDASYEDMYQLVDSAGTDFVHISVHWNQIEVSPGVYEDPGNILTFYNGFHASRGTKVLLTIIGPVNATIREMPSDLLSKPFDDAEVITRYNAFLDYIITSLDAVELIGLVISNEIDLYLKDHTDELEAFRSFFVSVKNHIEYVRPGVEIGSTSTLYGATNDLPDYLQNLNDLCDIVSVTYYPINHETHTVKPISTIRGDIAELCSRYRNSRIYFQECGYPSSPVCDSSEAQQSEFVEEMFVVWRDYSDQIEALSFYQLTDMSADYVDDYLAYLGLTGNEQLREFLRTLGFRTWEGSGNHKMAFERFTEITARR